jgi:hypothetical protein
MYNVYSFFNHKNLYSSFLFLSLPFAIYGIIYFNQNWKKTAIASSVLIFSTILILGNRASYLAIFTSILFVFIVKFKDLNNWVKLSFTFILSTAIVVLVLVFPARFNLNSVDTTNSLAERIQIWGNTIELIKEHPFLGVGAGNWQFNFEKYGVAHISNITQNYITFQKPHNGFLSVWSETGTVGFVILMVIIICIVSLKWRKLFVKRKLDVVIFFAGLVGLTVISCFSFPKERVLHIVLIMLTLSFLFFKEDGVKFKINRLILYFISALLIFNITISVFKLNGEYYTREGLINKSNNQAKEAFDNFIKAKSVFYKTDPTSTPIASYLGWCANLLNDQAGLYKYSELAYGLAPYDYEVLSNYGFVLSRNRDFKKARVILEESYRINPYFEPTLLNLVVLEYNEKNYKKAEEFLIMIPNYRNKFREINMQLGKKLIMLLK